MLATQRQQTPEHKTKERSGSFSEFGGREASPVPHEFSIKRRNSSPPRPTSKASTTTLELLQKPLIKRAVATKRETETTSHTKEAETLQRIKDEKHIEFLRQQIIDALSEDTPRKVYDYLSLWKNKILSTYKTKKLTPEQRLFKENVKFLRDYFFYTNGLVSHAIKLLIENITDLEDSAKISILFHIRCSIFKEGKLLATQEKAYELLLSTLDDASPKVKSEAGIALSTLIVLLNEQEYALYDQPKEKEPIEELKLRALTTLHNLCLDKSEYVKNESITRLVNMHCDTLHRVFTLANLNTDTPVYIVLNEKIKELKDFQSSFPKTSTNQKPTIFRDPSCDTVQQSTETDLSPSFFNL